MAHIGFIGLGNMGAPMAANAVKAGYKVRGYDVSPARCEVAAKDSVLIASSVADAVRDADIFITMLSSGAIVLDVWREALPSSGTGRAHYRLFDRRCRQFTRRARARKTGRTSIGGCAGLGGYAGGIRGDAYVYGRRIG